MGVERRGSRRRGLGRGPVKLPRPDLGQVLDHYEIHYGKSGSGNQKIRCPHPEHSDRDASCSLNLGEGVWNCFACGERGDAITLIMLMEGFESVADAFKFGQSFVSGSPGGRVPGQPRRGGILSGQAGYRPRYRREVPARGRPDRPFS
ncbi:CHC2 zinc finger domain-containing protein [Kineococcus sp. NPDC059986]|uniref:CHC2 zinc finger domain-containing protein n=1 Tax=Kineococcus sp. NPDC059986 TaxID=3155538 RepID=UPI00344EC7F3